MSSAATAAGSEGPAKRLAAYTRRAVRNWRHDAHRSRKAHAMVVLFSELAGKDGTGQFDPAEDNSSTPRDAAERNLEMEDVLAATRSLTAGERLILLLHYLHGFSDGEIEDFLQRFPEIARIYRIPTNRSRLCVLRNKVLALLRGLLGEGGEGQTHARP